LTSPPRVTIAIVTYNSARHVEACLTGVARQSYPSLEVFVVDNASTDDTVPRVREAAQSLKLVENDVNRGFAAAHNQAIRLATGEYYLSLNPDVVLNGSFVAEVVRAAESDPATGSVTGKLIRSPRVIDSTGIYMTPNVRHLDRGSEEQDRGQYERCQYVFGASGAAAFYRRQMLQDVAIDDEFFDEDFFVYREDADLAWRAQLLGWRAIYTPHAVATHERRVVPERRKSLPPELNMHSVKNRFLMRLKNQSIREWLSLPLGFVRDLQVIGYVLLVERTSLPGLLFVVRHVRRIRWKRNQIAARRTASAAEMLRWFKTTPVAFDVT
jgi:GT2 family glycosyltransferase